MKRKIVPITLVSLLLGLAFDFLFYGKIPGISAFIFSSLILACTFYLAKRFKARLNKSIFWLSPMIIFFSLMIAIRSSPFLVFVNIILIMYLLLMVARLALQPNSNLGQYKVKQYLDFIVPLPIRFVLEFIQTLMRAMSNRNNAQKSSYGPILRGFLLSLPFLVIFLLLFSSADLVFAKYVGSIFDLSIAGETIFRWGLIGFVASLFVGAYALIFIHASMPASSSTLDKKGNGLGTTESSIILGSVGLLFFVFVLVQLTYLFGGSDQITSTGYTYAQYARKGFFELIAVAVLSFLLIWAIKSSTGYRDLKEALVLKWLSGVLVIEVVIIMLSAHMRLNLYEQAYGFTTLRLLSHIFIVWLAAAFALLLTYIIREGSESKFALRMFMSIILFFALINIINPDAFIARQNIKRFNNTGKLDINYLGSLSEDATPAISGLLNHPNDKLQKNIANLLYYQKLTRQNRINHWQSANLARQQANRIFQDKTIQLEAGKSYYDYSEFNTGQ